MSAPAYELLAVEPGSLLLDGGNIRSLADLDEAFLQSIETHGVLVPITARRDRDDNLVVVTGHRRTMAAAKLGVPEVPVWVLDDLDHTHEADRLMAQLAENDQRSGVSTLDRAQVVDQLALFGYTAREIAQATSMPEEHVAIARRVVASEVSRATAADQPQATLDQLAAIAEFEDDPEAVKHLEKAIASGGFDHAVASYRADRAREAALEALRQEQRDAGLGLVVEWDPAVMAKVEDLVDVEDHAACPGRSTWVTISWFRASGSMEPVAEEVCLDWRAYGHGHKYRRDGHDTAEREAQLQAARERQAQRQQEWATAAQVRREFIATILRARKMPAGWGHYVANQALAQEGLRLPSNLLAQLLGLVEVEDGIPLLPQTATQPAAERMVLGIALAATEEITRLNPWSGADALRRHWDFLESAGYELAPIEVEQRERARGRSDDDVIDAEVIDETEA